MSWFYIAIFMALLIRAPLLSARSLEDVVDVTALLLTKKAIGTAFLIDEEYVVTNAHVLGRSKCSTIFFAWKDGSHNGCASIVARDDFLDIAVIKLKLKESRTPLAISDFRSVKIGNEIYVVGNPSGSLFLTSKSIVSSRDFSDLAIYPSKIPGRFNFDGALNPGNSGGPIVDSIGNVIGIASATRRGTTGVNVGIRSDTLIAFLKHFDVPFRLAFEPASESPKSTNHDSSVATTAPGSSHTVASDLGTSASQSPGNAQSSTPINSGYENTSFPSGGGIENPFTWDGLVLGVSAQGGIDYGDYSSHDASLKERNIDKLTTGGISGFLGADIGVSRHQWSSIIGIWCSAYRASSATANNTFVEQFSDQAPGPAQYEDYLSRKKKSPDGVISSTETEIGAYLFKFLRLSTGSGHAQIDLHDTQKSTRTTASGAYRVNTMGLMLGIKSWGITMDVSKLYGEIYPRTAVRSTFGITYQFGISD